MLSFPTQFFPQSFDMGVHSAGSALIVISPNPVQKLFPAEYLSGIFHEKKQ